MSRPGYSQGSANVKSLIVSLVGPTLATFAALTRKIQMPETGKIIGIHLNVAGVGGTFSVGTLDVLDDGVSLLTAVFDIAAIVAGTPVDKEGSALASSGATVAKDSVIALTTAVTGGTSPTWQGADLQIDYIASGD